MTNDDTTNNMPPMISAPEVLARVGDGWPTAIHCHDDDAFAQRFMEDGKTYTWEQLVGDDGVHWCRYCGSCSPEDVLRLLVGGARLGGADWKYGWPHKFYISGKNVPRGQVKWKNEHLLDLDDETFTQFVAILERYTHISFSRKQNDAGTWDLSYRAPYRGYQAY